MEEFEYLVVLFTSEGKMEPELDRRIGAALAEMRTLKQGHPGEAQSRAMRDDISKALEQNVLVSS